MGVHILPSTLSVEFLFHTFCESVVGTKTRPLQKKCGSGVPPRFHPTTPLTVQLSKNATAGQQEIFP